jgi:anaerobic ribonucleoside-triphosphate reductase
MSGKEVKVPVEVYSRVVGYFRPVNQWNKGKQEEFLNRKEYKVSILDNSPVYECQGNL